MWRPHITGHRQPAVPPMPPPRYVFTPPPPPQEPGLGNLHCSARACNEATALPCEQLDRSGRACPTAWCRSHRAISDGRVLCPLHGGTEVDAESTHPQLAATSWAARQVDAVIAGAVRAVSEDAGQQFVADPIRLLHVGIDRTRTWERMWKSVSHLGISLRVLVAIAEPEPDTVLAKVNGNVVAAVALPAAETRRRSDETGDESDPAIVAFRDAITHAVVAAVTSWDAIERARAADVVHLRGAPQGYDVAI